MRQVSVWAYPWDLHDIGLDTALGRIRAAGGTMVSLAASYHAGRFLQPGNPRRRVWFPQDGTVYYRTDPERWKSRTIRPLQADVVTDEGDFLAQVCDRRDSGGPAVSCWTVCLHNTRLGQAHPGDVLRNAFGDPALYGLCPSSPAAQDYVVTLCREIAEVYAPDRIELESPDFMGFAHGYHHEKDGLGLTPDQAFLLGICFCDHCMTAARAEAVPADAARADVVAILEAALAAELPQTAFPAFAADGIAVFDGRPALAAYLRWRGRPVARLIAAIRDAVPKATRLLLIDFAGSWQGGVDLGLIAPHVDGVLHCAYTTAPDRIPAVLAPVRAMLRDKTLVTGFHLFHPDVADRADLAARVAAAAPFSDGFNFYNLGLVPPARLDWIRTALPAPTG